ncbi:MAG: Ppx/GppA family phosphatase [Thermoplasmata archaeon]|nr:Ppx/GppA family phosphatase [Thermoplasmata archaeon]
MGSAAVVSGKGSGTSIASRSLVVIDLGSNTSRVVLYDTTPDGGLRSVGEAKELTRLGAHVTDDGTLDAEAIERAIATMHRFRRRIEGWGSPPVVAVATSVVRAAPNVEEFVKAVERGSGLRLRVLTEEQEARCAYLAVASSWELDEDVLFDMGGGSLQVVVTHKGRSSFAASRPLGALRLARQFLEHDPPKEKELEALRDHVRSSLESLPLEKVPKGAKLYGVGGTVRALARVAMLMREYPIPRVHGFELRKRDVEALAELLLDLPSDRREEVPGISADRADLLPAGIITVSELLRATGAEEVTVCGFGVREGAALETIGATLPVPAVTLARRSVEAARLGLGFSLDHGEAVADVALLLFDRLRGRFKWSEEDRLALTIAAWMHDSGAAVDWPRHGWHSAYFVQNVSLRGLSHRATQLAAVAVALHEGDPLPEPGRKTWRRQLGEADLETGERLGALLLVAEAAVDLRARVTAPDDGRLLLTVTEGSRVPVHPRTLSRLARPARKMLGMELEVRGG